MKTNKTNLKSAALLAGAIMAGSASGYAMTQASNGLMNYANLGSGAEIRSELFRLNDVSNVLKTINNESAHKFIELTCGEGKCGEGKCGEAKESTKTSENKADESKCGEAKCGEDKNGEVKNSDVKSDDVKSSDQEKTED